MNDITPKYIRLVPYLERIFSDGGSWTYEKLENEIKEKVSFKVTRGTLCSALKPLLKSKKIMKMKRTYEGVGRPLVVFRALG